MGLTGQVGVNYSSRMIEVRQTAEFKNWLLALKDRRAADRIAIRIARLETGNFGDTDSIGDGVRELRIHAGPGYRVYFTRRGPVVVILLCGGDKGSQKRDIRRAKEMAKEIGP